MPANHPIVETGAALARASKHAKRYPLDLDARNEVQRCRADLAEAKLADYVARTVSAAPELSAAQRARIALLLAPTAA